LFRSGDDFCLLGENDVTYVPNWPEDFTYIDYTKDLFKLPDIRAGCPKRPFQQVSVHSSKPWTGPKFCHEYKH
jgi:hypothetical protein